MRFHGTLSVLAMVLAAGLLGGCKGQPVVTVSLDPKLGGASGIPAVPIDIVGVNESERARLSEYSMTNYWKPGDTQRASVSSKTINLNADLTPGQKQFILAGQDPIWKTWKERQAQYLFILVNWPRPGDDKPGELDARRAIVPLDPDRWDTWPDKIDVVITPGGVTYSPSPKPASK